MNSSKSNYNGWDKWAENKDWSFFGHPNTSKMLISGKFRNRDVQITTQQHETIVDDRRNEAEIRIFLRQNLPDGFRIQPEVSVDRKVRASSAVEFKTGIEKFDNNLYIAANDIPSSQWLLSFPKVRLVLNQMLKEHSTTRIMGRSIMIRRNGYNTKKFDDALINGFKMAEALDDQLIIAWKACQQNHSLQPPTVDANGFPRMEGKIDGFNIRMSVNQGQQATLSVRVELGLNCPKDLEICGIQSDRAISRSPMRIEELDASMVIGLSTVNTLRILMDLKLQMTLRNLFKKYPRSSLINGRLRLLIFGRGDPMLEELLTEALSASREIKRVFQWINEDHPDAPFIPNMADYRLVMETSEPKEKGDENRTKRERFIPIEDAELTDDFSMEEFTPTIDDTQEVPIERKPRKPFGR